MSQKPDDFEALKTICNALEPFNEIDRERIIRWASERLGIKISGVSYGQQSQQQHPVQTIPVVHPTGSKDIRSFLQEKNPTSANQLVAAVAYYYKFEAPDSHKKSSINAEDVVDACRKAGRERPKFPNEIMANAKNYGLVDKVGPGLYEINAVGENLVAVSMPGGAHGNSGKKRKAKKPSKK